MRNLKRVLVIGLAAVMLVVALSMSAFAAQSKFTDVNTNDETLTNAVSLLEGLGITKGTSATTFGTNEYVTRAQMAAFIYRLMHTGKSLEGGYNHTAFEDLFDDTYFGMISWADAMGIIKGKSATEFDPDGSITLQDAYTMLIRALGYENGEVLSYPHSHIGLAEQKGIDLGEGLPSKVEYDTKLTRGNVAVLLYNAFYAEMAKTVTVEEVRLLGQNSAKPKYVLETVEKHPRLCEDIYEVIEEKFVVRETSHYAFNDTKTSTTYKPTEDINGTGTMRLVGVLGVQQNVQEFYTTAKELGLSGKADDYIMAELSVFFQYDEKAREIENILFTESRKSSISSEKMNINFRVDAPTDRNGTLEHYYVAGTTDSTVRRFTGRADVEGKQLYFYDAPYTYASPTYESGATEAERYEARNADNVKLIDLKCLDTEKGLYSFYKTDDVFTSHDGYDVDTGVVTANHASFAKKFQLPLNNGFYKLEIYDVDGDGRYEYMWYKPASFAKIVMNEDKLTSHSGVVNEAPEGASPYDYTKVPTIYAKGAKLYGAAFNDGDYVAAYVNADANMIDILGVAEGKKGTITKLNNKDGFVTVGSLKLDIKSGGKMFHEYFAHAAAPSYKTDWTWSLRDHFLGKAVALNSDIIAYVYKGNLYAYELVDVKGSYNGENVLVPLETYTKAVRNESFELEQYLKVLVDGEVKYVQVDPENCYPEPRKADSGEGYVFDNQKIEENNKKYDVYLGKICTYSVDKNGVYTIKSMLHGSSENKLHDHIDLVYDKDEFIDSDRVNQAGIDLKAVGESIPVYLKKHTSTRYKVVNAAGDSFVGTEGNNPDGTEQYWFNDVNIENATFMFRIIDRVGTKEDQFVTYVGKELPGTVTSTLYNTQMIYQNRGDNAEIADLILFYAEVDNKLVFDAGFQDTDFIIVKGSEVTRVAEDEYSYAYEVFNPATGTVISNVLGTASKTTVTNLTNSVTPYEPGSILQITRDNKLDDEIPVGSRTHEVLFDNNPVDEKLGYLLEVDAVERIAEIVPVRATVDDTYFKWGQADVCQFYEIAEDANIVVLNFDKREDITTAEIATLTLEELAEAEESIKCYTSTYMEDPTDPDAKYETVYCKYVKAYIDAEYSSKADAVIIKTIVVVVHPGMSNSDTNLDVE